MQFGIGTIMAEHSGIMKCGMGIECVAEIEGDRIRISRANVREVVRAVQVIILPDQDAYGRTDGAVNIRSNSWKLRRIDNRFRKGGFGCRESDNRQRIGYVQSWFRV